MTFSGRQVIRGDLLKLTKTDIVDLDRLIKKCTFLQVNDDSIEFASEAHRRYAAKLLEAKKNDALGLQVEYLMLNPESAIAVRFLPNYYQQLDQTLELIRLLNSEHFERLFFNTASIASLRARAELGIKSALIAKDVGEAFGFSLKKSVFSSIVAAKGHQSEIKALVALGEDRQALALAESSVIKEERLAFLSSFAKQCKETNVPVRTDVHAQILELSKEIDFTEMGDAAVEIAADLVSVDPELAMSIVERASSEHGDQRKKDVAYAHLSLAGGRKSGGGPRDAISNAATESKISDAALQSFGSSIVALISKLSAEKVIEIARSLDERHRLHFLSEWIRRHKKLDGAIDVSEAALNIMIDAATYVPKMSELSAFALPLPYSVDNLRVRTLVDRFDSQRNLIKDASMSAPGVQLQMLLAHALYRGDREAGSNRLLEVYYEVSETASLDVKIDCFAIILKALSEIDLDHELEGKHGLKAVISGELEDAVSATLSNTAEHFLIVKGALAALAHNNLDKAIQIAMSLNTEARRDSGLSSVFASLCRDGMSVDVVADMQRVGTHIVDTDIFDSNVQRILSEIFLRKYKLPFTDLSPFLKLVEQIRTPEFRCVSAARLVGIGSRLDDVHIVAESLVIFDASLPDCASPTFVTDICYTLAWTLAAKDKATAGAYFEKAQQAKRDSAFSSNDHLHLALCALGLIARALGWLAKNSGIDDDTMGRFLRLVDMIEAPEAKAEVLADTACRIALHGRPDIAKRLMVEHCQPIVDETLSSVPARAGRVIAVAFPAIFFLVHKETAFEYLAHLPDCDKSDPLSTAASLILTKRSWTDPGLERGHDRYKISYAEAQDVCTLIEHFTRDSDLYYTLNDFARTVVHKNSSRSLTAQQRESLASRLHKTIVGVLPDKKNIRHEGYLILCLACEQQVRADSQKAEWQGLINRAKRITNAADRSFVFYELSHFLPKMYASWIADLRADAFTTARLIPSTIDQINRLLQLSTNASPDVTGAAKEALRSAMAMTFVANDQELSKANRRQILDAAEKIDEKFAAELGEMADDDPARASARAEVKEELEMLKTRKTLTNSVTEGDASSNSNTSYVARAAWTAMGRLIDGRIECKAPEVTSAYLRQSSRRPLDICYPVFAWHIENLGTKYQIAREADSKVRPLVEQLLTSTELAATLIGKLRHQNPGLADRGDGDGIMLMNDRDAALSKIGAWLRDCDKDIVFCDPYFSPDDVLFLALVLANCPSLSITILTSKQQLVKKQALDDEAFSLAWKEIRDQDPPRTKIIAVSHAESMKSALHDRWILSGKRGLRLGTSFNSIGGKTMSEISPLSPAEASATVEELAQFVDLRSPVHGVRLSYVTLTIG